MKIQLPKDKLKEILQIVTNVCPQKTDLSILNYFYLLAQNDEVYISATDLELNYQTRFPARILKEGRVLIPAKQFERIIDNFYEDEVLLEAKHNFLEIRGEKSVSTLPGLSYEEFPTFSEINQEKYFEIDNENFEDYLDRLYPILATSDIRPEYSGIYFDLDGEKLNLVATDTIRLGVQRVKSQFFETNLEKISVLIPKRILQEYRALKRKTGKLKIYFEENQITFEVLNHFLTAKLLAIEYPNYSQFISPTNFLFTFLVDREEILKSLKLAKVFLDQFKETELNFDLDENKLEIYTKNELLGENKNELNIEIKENNLTDKEFKIKFHLDFLYDGFEAIESDKILAGFFSGLGGESTPIYLKSPLDDDFVYISVHR
jgi:DNA polymerase-3 subunit beta